MAVKNFVFRESWVGSNRVQISKTKSISKKFGKSVKKIFGFANHFMKNEKSFN